MRRRRPALLAVASLFALVACRSSVSVPFDDAPAQVSVRSIQGQTLLVTWSAVPGARQYHLSVANGSGPGTNYTGDLYEGTGKSIPFPTGSSNLATVTVTAIFPGRESAESAPVTAYFADATYSPRALWSGSGQAIGDGYGRAIAAGDFDGDGMTDLAVGAPGASGRGKVYVYRGTTRGLATTSWGPAIVGAPLDELGVSLLAGPFSHPGNDDLLIGVPGGNQVLHFPGFTSGLSPYWNTAIAPAGMTRFGESMAAIHDVSGDGHPDVVIGAPGDPGAEGGISCWQGGLGGAGPVWSMLSSAQPGDRFGAALAAVGDKRIAVGIPGRTLGGNASAGLVELHDSVGGAYAGQLEASADGALFGTSVADPGDVDGDGFDDIAIGAPLSTSGTPGVPTGRLWVFFGSAQPDVYDTPAYLDGSPDDRYGASIAGLPGPDAFGATAKILVGDSGQSAARVVRQSAGRSLTEDNWYATDIAQPGFGEVVATVRDLNGDGRPEIAIASPGVGPGAVRIYPSWADASPVVSAGEPQRVARGVGVRPIGASFTDPSSPRGWYRCTWSWDGAADAPFDCTGSDPAGSAVHVFDTPGTHWVKLRVDALHDGRFTESVTRIDVR